MQSRAAASGGFAVTETAAGEWLAYTIFIRRTGMYNLDVRYASESPDGTFHIELDNRNISGTMTIVPTGNREAFRNVSLKVKLPAGQQKLKLVIDSDSSNPRTNRLSESAANFDSINIRAAKSDYDGNDAGDLNQKFLQQFFFMNESVFKFLINREKNG